MLFGSLYVSKFTKRPLSSTSYNLWNRVIHLVVILLLTNMNKYQTTNVRQWISMVYSSLNISNNSFSKKGNKYSCVLWCITRDGTGDRPVRFVPGQDFRPDGLPFNRPIIGLSHLLSCFYFLFLFIISIGFNCVRWFIVYMISFDHSNEIWYTVSMLPAHFVLLGAKTTCLKYLEERFKYIRSIMLHRI